MAIRFNPETRKALLIAAWAGTAMMGYYGVSSWYAANPGADGIIMAVGMFSAFAAGTVAFSAVLFDAGNRGWIRALALVALACLFAIDMWASSHHLQTGTLESVVSAQNATDDKTNQRDYVRSLQTQLAACNPTHVTKCVKPLSDKLAAAQADLQALSGDTQVLKDQVESDSWQWMVDLMNTGARPGEELTRADVIARFSLFVGGFLYLMIVFAHGLLGSGELVMEAVGLDDEEDSPTPLPPTGTDGDRTGRDYDRNSPSPRNALDSYAPSTDHTPARQRAASRWHTDGNAALQLDDTAEILQANGFKQSPEQLKNVYALAAAHNRSTPHPNAVPVNSTPVPNTRSEHPTPAEQLSDPANFSLLKRVVNHPRFENVIVGIATGAIAPTQRQMMRTYSIGGDLTYWLMVILEAWGIVSESNDQGKRTLLDTLTEKTAISVSTEIKQVILGD